MNRWFLLLIWVGVVAVLTVVLMLAVPEVGTPHG